jgi:hypothetical protein
MRSNVICSISKGDELHQKRKEKWNKESVYGNNSDTV